MTSGLFRSAVSGPTVAAAALGLIGFTTLGFGAALVGETRRTETAPKATAAIEAMKAEYKRPASIPFPKENPYTPDKAALGKKLYFDTRLSVSSAQSCASCHSPGFGWGDGLAVGVGHGMAKLGRHSPTIINAAWGAIFMWDGRLANLEEQALGPIQAAGEMNMPLDKLMERLAAVEEYKPLFEASFPGVGLKRRHARPGHCDLRTDRGFRTGSVRQLDRGQREGDIRGGQARFPALQHQGAMLVLP